MKIDRRDQIPGLIARYRQAGQHHRVPLLMALYTGAIAYAEVKRGTGAGYLRSFMSRTAGRTAVLLVGDDDYQSSGPAGWPMADAMVRWSRFAIIHATGAEVRHYQGALLLAEAHGTVLFVETASAQEAAWVEAVQAAPGDRGLQIIRTRSGGVHPVLPAVRQ